MNRYQIDNTITGPCLDRLVAKKIMGNQVVEDEIFGLMEMHTNKDGIKVYYPLRDYSNNIQAARMVVAKMVRMAYHDEAAYWQTEDRPDVICKAALRAIFQRKRKADALKTQANLRAIELSTLYPANEIVSFHSQSCPQAGQLLFLETVNSDTLIILPVAHPEMTHLPDIFVCRKILSSEYQPYAFR